jgi:hypothetical protein
MEPEEREPKCNEMQFHVGTHCNTKMEVVDNPSLGEERSGQSYTTTA